ncbi:hypothetical protein ALO91_05593, partial [Pseudomonas syringae pv. aceris]
MERYAQSLRRSGPRWQSSRRRFNQPQNLLPRNTRTAAPAPRHRAGIFLPGETPMPITTQQLLQILPNAGQKAGVFAPVLNTAMSKYQIVTPLRIAAF